MDNNKSEKYMPDKVIENLLENLFPREQKKTFLVTMITSVITAFLSYFMLMVNGYAGPDAINEGVYLYRSFDYAISLGRWFIAYVYKHVVGNAIVPFLIVMMYAILVGLSAYILFRMMNVKSTISHILVSAIFVSFPVVTLQFGYLYMAAFYAYSFFCVVAGTQLIRTKKLWGFIAAAVLFVTMLGSYQSYIGGIAALAVLMLIVDIVDGKKTKTAFLDFGLVALVGALSCAINLLVVNLTIAKEGIEKADRVTGFSFADIFENFGFSFKYSFIWFFTSFEDKLFSRDMFYLVTFICLIVVLILFVIRLIKEKKILEGVILLISVYLIPHCMNLVQYLFPHNGISGIMKYHYVMMFVLLVALIERCDFKLPKCITQWCAYVCMFLLINTFILSANIAGLVYKTVYTENYTEASAMINRVYELPGYVRDETKVVLVNPIDWTTSYKEFGLLLSETSIGAGPVFWNGFLGLNNDRRGYFLNYLGVETGFITQDELDGILFSDEYDAMPIWPAEGSVKMINGYAVIKNE